MGRDWLEKNRPTLLIVVDPASSRWAHPDFPRFPVLLQSPTGLLYLPLSVLERLSSRLWNFDDRRR